MKSTSLIDPAVVNLIYLSGVTFGSFSYFGELCCLIFRHLGEFPDFFLTLVFNIFLLHLEKIL